MEVFFVLFILVLGVVVIGSIMGMTSSGRITKLEQQNRNLHERVRQLEAAQDPLMARPQQMSPASNPEKPIEKPATQAPPNITTPQPVPVAAKAAPVPIKSRPEPLGARETFAPSKSRAAPKRSKPAKPTRNLEEIIGGQWSVWVGGLALLIGAVLLIRFSIEAGFFGPGARIVMASILGFALLAAGEWLKRSDDKVQTGKLGEAAKALQGNASVPGLLSAVGIFTLLGTTYAAHELYGFISAPVGFIGLGVISLGAMALSLRQGPVLAVIGLLASLATPLLVQTQTPNFMALVGYLLVIGCVALVLARRTDWRWLEPGVVFGWLFWSFMSLAAATGGQLPLWSAFLAIGFGVTVWLTAQQKQTVKSENSQTASPLAEMRLNPIFSVLWGLLATILVGYVVSNLHSGITGLPMQGIVLSIGTLVALCGAALFFRPQCGHLLSAGFFALSMSLLSGPQGQIIFYGIATYAVALLCLREAFSRNILPKTKQPDIFWSGFSVVLGLAAITLWGMFGPANWSSQTQALWAFAYAALFAAAAIYFHVKSKSVWQNMILTVGAALAWAFSVGGGFDGLSVSIGLSIGAVIMVAAMGQLDLPGSRLGLLGLAGLVFAHAFLVQFPQASSLSARLILNELWIYLAFPTAILGGATYLRRGVTSPSKEDRLINAVIETAALAGLALFFVFQIRHLSNAGAVYVDKIGFPELGMQVSTGLCFTLAGLSKRFSANLVLSKMAELISYVTLGIFAIGTLFALSPLFNGSERIGGNAIFNALTTGLLVPTILLSLCSWRAKDKRPEFYVNLLGGLALAGALSWVTAMIRFSFNGEKIDIFDIRFGDVELWTISAIWLAFGIALLAIGVWRKIRPLRIASGVVIILTVLKAFLIDMSGLEGVLRALSFVVLGLILIMIGRAYQRYWLSGNETKLEPISNPISATD